MIAPCLLLRKGDLLEHITIIPLLGLCIAAFLLVVLIVLTVRGGVPRVRRGDEDETPPRQL